MGLFNIYPKRSKAAPRSHQALLYRLLLAAALVLIFPVDAGLQSWCERWLSRSAVINEATVSPQEKPTQNSVQNALKDAKTLPRVDYLHNRPWHWTLELLAHLPSQLLSAISPKPDETATRYQKRMRQFITNFNIPWEHPIQMIIESIEREGFSRRGRALRDELQSWLRQNPENRRRVLEDIQTTAGALEDHKIFLSMGAVDLPIEVSNGIQYLALGPNFRYEVKQQNNGVYHALVPRERVRHPAWNPLQSKNLIGIIQDRVPRPEIYLASVGHDGYFYLQDGNHRFHVLEHRPMVWVEIPAARTMPWSHYLDTVGITQPQLSEISAIVQGHRTPMSLLPLWMQKHILIHF